MPPIPEVLSAREEQFVRVLSVYDPLDTKVFRDLQSIGYKISPDGVLDGPLSSVTVYQNRDVDLTSFRVDEKIREQVMADGVDFKGIEIADVLKYVPGGQWGASQGGLYFYLEHGPLVVSTAGRDALEKVAEAFERELHNSAQARHPENLLEDAVRKAMGPLMMPKRERIPVAILSIPGSGTEEPFVARYFPDAKAVIDAYGQLLPYTANDQKLRASVAWQDLWPTLP